MVNDDAARVTVGRFAAAILARDEAGARACAADWERSSDGAARLYGQLTDEEGCRIEVAGASLLGAAGRVVVPVVVRAGGRIVQKLSLLGDGYPWRIAGVAVNETHVDCYLAAEAPARLAWRELD